MNKKEKKKGRSVFGLILYFFDIPERKRHERQYFQQKLDEESYEQLVSEYSITKERYDKLNNLYKLIKSVSIISFLASVISIGAKWGLMTYNHVRNNISFEQKEFAYWVFVMLVVVVFGVALAFLIFIKNLMISCGSRADMIKNARDMKADIHKTKVTEKMDRKQQITNNR
ncbi:hypothetical protein [Lactobacillus sp. ESL0681]|uniref:hypothetical protein n=1 Tax=Lactobacillus sp. ESL0681 TaxID=2983211 RepID=UPI0023F88AFB|nr:hypothetical protein [Lactobacillus sp. ESL0681]WEV41322.1 hypothetical protein OZX59_09340 [Lactobacillus sp. ESL0681]